MGEVLLSLRALVRTKTGRVVVHRGEPLPEDATAEAVKRLRNLGVLGDEAALAPEPEGDDLTALDDELLVEFVKSHTAEEVVKAAGSDVELAQRLLDAEQDAKDRKTAVDGLEKVIDGD